MKRSSGAFLGAIAAAALLTGCNNNNNGGFPPPPTTGPGCGTPPYDMEVLYPKPNAAAIPPGVSAVYVAFNNSLSAGNQYDLRTVDSTGTFRYTVNASGQPVTGAGSGFTPVSASQIPAPHANPTYPNPVYYVTYFQANYGPIGPLTTVNMYWNDYGTNCTPNVIVSSFSTK
jgi:hypothetical protein